LEAETVFHQTSSEALLQPQSAGQILVADKGLLLAYYAIGAEISQDLISAHTPDKNGEGQGIQ